MNEEIIFCANDPEASRHYGDIQRVFVATEKTDCEHSEVIRHAVDFYGISAEEAAELVNPEKIVSSAGVWEDVEFINYLYGETKYFSKFNGIITRDGAVFFEIGANLVETNYLKEGE